MSLRAALILVGTLIVPACFSSFASAVDLSAPDDSWEPFTDGKAYRIYSRDGRLPDTREVMLRGILEYPPRRVFEVCTDYRHYQDFMPDVTFSEVIHAEESDAHKRIIYVFYYFEAPLVSPRYYTPTSRTIPAGASLSGSPTGCRLGPCRNGGKRSRTAGNPDYCKSTRHAPAK